MGIMVIGVSTLFCVTSIPVKFFSYSKLPVIEVVIENEKYYLELDTGEAGDIVLKEKILQRLKKEQIASVKTVDINGNIYEDFNFLIPKINISGVEFVSVVAKQENMSFLTEGCVIRDSPINNQKSNILRHTNIAGRIGWGLLKDHQWYFDILHSLLWITDDLENIPEYFSISDYVEIPFEFEKNGIVILVNTNIGVKRFMLDTGASVSCLKEFLVQKKHSQEFEPGRRMFLSDIKIGGKDFGIYSFFLYNFCPMFDVDGILGIQFFKKNGIFLDFQNKKALIIPANRSFFADLIDRIHYFWFWLSH